MQSIAYGTLAAQQESRSTLIMKKLSLPLIIMARAASGQGS